MASLGDTAWQFIAGTLIIAILYVLVRPSSKAATAITDIGNALATVVRTAVS